MTTTVKVEAHCSSTVEVQVVIVDNGNEVEKVTLQDGETAERYVYDNRVISVQEVPKG